MKTESWIAGGKQESGIKPESKAQFHCVLDAVCSPDVCGQTANKAGLGDVCTSAVITPDNTMLLDDNSSWWAVILLGFFVLCEKM